MVYNDKTSSFEELSNKDNSVSIHHINTHALAMDMYKVATDMSLDIMNEVFKLRNTPHYNLRHTSHFSTDPIHSVYNGTESGRKYLLKLKIRILLMILRKKLKKWKPTECPCRICKTFVPNLRFV